MPRLQKLRRAWRHAFSLEPPPLTYEDRQLLARLAQKIVDRQMTLPASLFLRSTGPLNSLGSQTLVFLRPFLTPAFFQQDEYDRLAQLMDRRDAAELLVTEMEAVGGDKQK